MSKVKSIVAAALTLAAVGTAAQAAVFTQTINGVTLTITPEGTPVNSFNETATGYTAYLVSATSANNIISVAAIGSGAAKETGFTGPMLQELDYSNGRTGYTTALTPLITVAKGEAGKDYAVDSHLLTPLNGLTAPSGFEPAEDNNATLASSPTTTAPGAPAPDGYDEWGLGTTLTGTYTLGTGVTHSLDIAWLVIPNTGVVAYDFNVFTDQTTANGSQFDGVIPAATAPVPEPASLGLLGLGGVALLKRRKSSSSK